MTSFVGGGEVHRTVATAGHVDHGKSTLVRALTGMEPDRLEEERRRGLTIELGFAWTDLDDATVAFVDVPGHERLVRTMLAGAAAVPAVLFVVAADDGWSAQSSEHRDVLDLLGVGAVAVALTKCDLAGHDRTEEVADEVVARLAGTSLAEAPLVHTDAVTGRGLDELRQVLAAWASSSEPLADVGRPRLWVDRAFSPPGVGTVVTGTLTGGRLAVGASVEVLPGGARGRVRRLESLGRPIEDAFPAMRVALDLVGVDRDGVGRGDVVAASGPWRSTSQADLWLRVLDGQRLDRAGAWTLHAGTAAVGCRVAPWTGAIDGPGSGAVRVRLSSPLPLVGGDRVVLREAGRRATVAGGIVADPIAESRPRGGEARRRHGDAVRVAALAAPAERVTALLRLTEGGWCDAVRLRAAAGLPAGTPLPDTVVEVGDHVVLEPRWAAWEQALTSRLGTAAVDRGAAVAALAGAGAPRPLAEAVLDRLVGNGQLVRTGGGLALRAHAEAAADAVSGRAEALLRDLAGAPFAPEPLEVLAQRHQVDHRLLTALVNRGTIVRTGGLAFARPTIGLAVVKLAGLEAASGPFTAAQAKQAWGTTRRFAIPLLEHLDAAGLTRFDGRLRQLTDRGRALAAQSPSGPS
ncbi:selenocysteine-specific translation elongation factor [Egicoccus sp. AB-alg6-2]|uniref:selenocysteine-specific translation elongation factor n=1 Tax=Egicoccus sp. AB-alg6-2 TaxID=3242692 RepID=UPI00359E5E78